MEGSLHSGEAAAVLANDVGNRVAGTKFLAVLAVHT